MWHKEKLWIIKENPEAGNGKFQPEKEKPLEKLLSMIGLEDKEDIQEFLSPFPKKTYDPFLFKSMEAVVEKILEHIHQDKTICIYGDYDVDGVTSVSLLYEVLSCLTTKINYYIPSRFEEGYGLNKEALKIIKESGTDLVITADCGSTSVSEVEYGKQIGLDMIVTDHHHLGQELPDCLMLNPKQDDCLYPFKELCGCGVAFKLAQALQRKADLPKNILTGVLDLLAIGTVSDIVPLLDENRTFVKYGLREINKKKRKGLATLMDGIGLYEKEIKSYHIGYIIGPHINAAGRIDNALAGVELLITQDEQIIREKTALLIENNRERRNLQKEAFDACFEIVLAKHREDLFLVIDSPDTHEGVAGIVASKIKESFYRPTVIVTRSDEEGVLKGTGRSVAGIDIYEYMSKFKEHYIKFGGHSGACGFTIYEESIDFLRQNLNMEMKKIQTTHDESFVPKIYISLEISISDIDFEFIKDIHCLEPFGHKNEKPVFLIRDLSVEKKYFIGKDKEHVKLVLKDSCGYTIEGMAFNMKEHYEELSSEETVSIVGIPEISEFRGFKKIQFLIEDMKTTSEIWG